MPSVIPTPAEVFNQPQKTSSATGEAEKDKILNVTGGTYNKKNKIFETSFLETEKYVFEQVRCEHREQREPVQNVYIQYDKANDRAEQVDSYKLDGITYRPIESKTTDIVLLPSGIEEYETDDKLVEEISRFLFSYFEPPKYYEVILPYLLMFYWISDKFPFVPYLHFIGLTGTGKSTALETFGNISYKSINASGSITPAVLFRIAQEWRGTLLLDEFNIGNTNSDSYSEKLQILKGGVSDNPVLRTIGDKKKEVEAFRIKSPRVFSSQDVIQDAALQSRTIVVKMSKNTRKIPLYRLDSFGLKAVSLRNKLLLWRLRHLKSIDLKDIEFGFEALSRFDGRVQQVLTPIYYISNKETQAKIVNFATEQEEETKRERLEEIDGQIFQYLFDHSKEEVMLHDITQYVNQTRENQGYKNSYSERKLGNIVRKILGFNTERTRDGYRVVVNKSKVDDLAIYYGLSLSCTDSQPSQSSQIEANPKTEAVEIDELLKEVDKND